MTPPRRRPIRPALALAVTVALVAPLAAVTATAASAGPHHDKGHDKGHDRTSRQEAAKVDRVPAPDPGWVDCSAEFGPRAECGRVTLPLDYDAPEQGTTEVALLRLRATDPERRVGTLFVNPGGPDGSGVEFVGGRGRESLSGLEAQFDIVGFDPRGTNRSMSLSCFTTQAERDAAIPPDLPPFPSGSEQTAAFVASAKAVGQACSTVGAQLSASMSTAQVARDLDVLRRVVGDDKLTYLGFSYGTYLGNVYANMFPDRFRALALDGVAEPHAWRGDGRSAKTPTFIRSGSHESHWTVLQEYLARCGAAGPERCRMAGLGDPAAVYDAIAEGLRAAPVELVDPATGAVVDSFDYPSLILVLQGLLSARRGEALPLVDQFLWSIHWRQQQATADNADERAEAAEFLASFLSAGASEEPEQPSEAYHAVICTDGRHMARPERSVEAAARADAVAPGFGSLLTWVTAACASESWTARDEDRWTGAFDHRTAAPVLVVGNYWDPSTAYAGADAVASELPHSRLLASDSWGHVAYGSSACVTDAVDHYLLTGEPSPEGTVCVGDFQPFAEPGAAPAGPGQADMASAPVGSLAIGMPPRAGELIGPWRRRSAPAGCRRAPRAGRSPRSC